MIKTKMCYCIGSATTLLRKLVINQKQLIGKPTLIVSLIMTQVAVDVWRLRKSTAIGQSEICRFLHHLSLFQCWPIINWYLHTVQPCEVQVQSAYAAETKEDARVTGNGY